MWFCRYIFTSFQKVLWSSMGFYSRRLWNILQCSMGFQKVLWPSMAFYGLLWPSMTFHDGMFWNVLEHSRRFYSLLDASSCFHAILWESMRFHEVSWGSIMFYEVLCWAKQQSSWSSCFFWVLGSWPQPGYLPQGLQDPQSWQTCCSSLRTKGISCWSYERGEGLTLGLGGR